jgi:licheninase
VTFLRAVLAVVVLFGLGVQPAGATQQWRLVADDNFDGSLAPHWSAYHGTPSCCPETTWNPSQVTEQDGRLVLTSVRGPDGAWVTGGVSAAGWPAAVRTYGKYVARVRVDRGAGVSAVALLWPKSDHWPPEVDYYELSAQDADRTHETATVHRAGDDATRAVAYRGDLTRWHTVSVEWLPGSITYFVDGRETGRVTDVSYVPHQPMWPAFQMQVGGGDGTAVPTSGSGPVRLYVDWLAVYAPVDARPAPPAGGGAAVWWLVGGCAVVLVSGLLVIRRCRRAA